MTFWAIVFFSFSLGMDKPDMAVFPDKETCLQVYEKRTPEVVLEYPDIMTTGGCIEIKLISAAKMRKRAELQTFRRIRETIFHPFRSRKKVIATRPGFLLK